MKEFNAYLVKCGKRYSRHSYFAGGCWVSNPSKALLFSSKKDALFTSPELKFVDNLKFIHVRIKFITFI